MDYIFYKNCQRCGIKDENGNYLLKAAKSPYSDIVKIGNFYRCSETDSDNYIINDIVYANGQIDFKRVTNETYDQIGTMNDSVILGYVTQNDCIFYDNDFNALSKYTYTRLSNDYSFDNEQYIIATNNQTGCTVILDTTINEVYNISKDLQKTHNEGLLDEYIPNWRANKFGNMFRMLYNTHQVNQELYFVNQTSTVVVYWDCQKFKAYPINFIFPKRDDDMSLGEIYRFDNSGIYALCYCDNNSDKHMTALVKNWQPIDKVSKGNKGYGEFHTYWNASKNRDLCVLEVTNNTALVLKKDGSFYFPTYNGVQYPYWQYLYANGNNEQPLYIASTIDKHSSIIIDDVDTLHVYDNIAQFQYPLYITYPVSIYNNRPRWNYNERCTWYYVKSQFQKGNVEYLCDINFHIASVIGSNHYYYQQSKIKRKWLSIIDKCTIDKEGFVI